MKTLFILLLFSFFGMANASAQELNFSPYREIVSCGPNTVYFVYRNTVEPDQLTWYFGDGGTSYQASTTHYYQAPGVYTVKLVIEKNGRLDSVVKTNFVTILPKPRLRVSATKSESVISPKVFLENKYHANHYQYKWIVQDDTINKPSFWYNLIAPGTIPVYVKVTNEHGCTVDTSTVINYDNNGDISVGLPEASLSSLNVWPNPAHEKLYVQLPESTLAFHLKLMDAAGKTYEPDYTVDGQTICLTVNHLPKGNYLLQISASNGLKTYLNKIIVL